MESPETRRTPCPAIHHPFIPQPNFGSAINNIPVVQQIPIPEDPFQILPPAPPAPRYQHLPPALAQQLAALPPMPPPVQRKRRRQHQPPPPPPPPLENNPDIIQSVIQLPLLPLPPSVPLPLPAPPQTPAHIYHRLLQPSFSQT